MTKVVSFAEEDRYGSKKKHENHNRKMHCERIDSFFFSLVKYNKKKNVNSLSSFCCCLNIKYLIEYNYNNIIKKSFCFQIRYQINHYLPIIWICWNKKKEPGWVLTRPGHENKKGPSNKINTKGSCSFF